MKISVWGLVMSICLLMTGCSEKETPGGVKYSVIKKGDGKKTELGQFLVMNIELKDAKDSVWSSSKEMGYPIIMPVPDASMENDEGEYGVFKQLTKGDSVSFELAARIIFLKTRKRMVPPNVDPLSLFKFTVGLQDVWDENQANEFQQKMLSDRAKARAKNDSTTIANYLKENGLEAKSTSSGLRYIVNKEGTGEVATSGKTSFVYYAGYLLTGELFDTNIESVAQENDLNIQGRNNPYPVIVNTESVISGWDEILLLMNKGMKVTVYVPSALAYRSESPGGGIPPNAILVFDMEVVDIK